MNEFLQQNLSRRHTNWKTQLDPRNYCCSTTTTTTMLSNQDNKISHPSSHSRPESSSPEEGKQEEEEKEEKKSVVILYSIATSSSSSNDDDSGSSCSCEVQGKDKEQEDTQQGSHFGSSNQTRFGIWNVRSDFTMDGQNLDGQN